MYPHHLVTYYSWQFSIWQCSYIININSYSLAVCSTYIQRTFFILAKKPSPISSKNFLILMVWSSSVPKWPILVPFCGMDHQKSNFSLILALFLLEAIEASRCYFFENWWMKLKCPLLLKPLATIVQKNSQSFYPSDPFRISHFTMRHPVSKHFMLKILYIT